MIRLGFLGTGWIGRNRMEAILATGEAIVAAISDPNGDMASEAKKLAPLALQPESFEAMLALDLDGLVIATPSALHADQCIAALSAGTAVFCQKPLGRSAQEVDAVLEQARRSDRLLGVDLSYRHSAAIRAIRERIRSGELGELFAADLTFHNAYGPQSGWFWDRKLSGGGCLIDLGVHLVDLALWMFDFPDVLEVRATLLRDGRQARDEEVEDFALAELKLANGVTVRIACSWNLSAGRDAVIDATFYGTRAAGRMCNDNGSFFNFSAHLLRGRESEALTWPPDEWGGRAAAEWIHKLGAGAGFAASTSGLAETATVLDRLYRSRGYQPFTRSQTSITPLCPVT